MPLYEYRCASCGDTQERVFLAYKDAYPALLCGCGDKAVKVQYSRTSWKFGDNHLAKQGIIPADKDVMQDQRKARKDKEAAAEAKADASRRKYLEEAIAPY